MLLSVVVPCFNEEEVIGSVFPRLTGSLESIGVPYEIIFVNDGSRDRTLEFLSEFARSDARCRVLSLSRNFGHQNAVTAGIAHAAGDAVVLIDADLQDPPEIIGEMVNLWRQGYQVVFGVRATRHGETHFKRATAAMFYRTINSLSEIPIPLDTGDFRLMDRAVVDVLKRMPERDRFVRGMVSWAGFRQVALPYIRDARQAGESKYPLWKMLRFGLDGITSFSTTPLKLATWIGFGVSIFALMGVMYALVVRLFTQAWVPGWAGLFIAVLFLGGIQLVFLGILGEYVGRIYGEVKRRPLYVIDEASSIRVQNEAR